MHLRVGPGIHIVKITRIASALERGGTTDDSLHLNIKPVEYHANPS